MRSYTFGELVLRLEKIVNAENNTVFSAFEKREALASAIAETWDCIVSAGLGDRHVKTAEFNTVADQLEYDLEDEAIVEDLDFYQVQQLYVDEGSGYLRPIERINAAEVGGYRPPQAAVAMKLYYIPSAPTYLDELVEFDDDLTFDGINGWEEHALQTAAMTLKKKKEDDYSPFRQRKVELEERMARMGSQDASQGARVVRRRGSRRNPMWYPNAGAVTAYGIRGHNLELYFSYPWSA